MEKENKSTLRNLPSVEQMLEITEIQTEIECFSRPLVTEAVRQVIAETRQKVKKGGQCPPLAEITKQVCQCLHQSWPGFLSPVINGTGVILHTNLGRAPLSAATAAALAELSGQYSNLESDLASGERGIRAAEVEKLLCQLTGAESALVVNNNAAAVYLILSALAANHEAIVSRGELVQIGGGFRIPDIMRQSNARLVEVGTTNQTYDFDYEAAISEETGLILKVHPSNFAIRGFACEVSTAELKVIAKKYGLPLVYDLGSGALLPTEDFMPEHEPTVQEALAEGADVVCFSGDKLLGGPQSGIILGSKGYIDQLRRHPLLRTVRIGKLTAWALQSTLLHYLRQEALTEIPVWRTMSLDIAGLQKRAETIARKLKKAGLTAKVIDGQSTVGGGSLPDQTLASKLVAINPPVSVDDFATALRLASPPVVGLSREGQFLIDVRTVPPSWDNTLVKLITESAKGQ